MRIDPDTLREMADRMSAEDRDEMAIPSFLHKNPALRWMAWRRIEVMAALIARACPAGGRLLDFGCGTGVLFEAELERASEVIGVDLVLTAAKLWTEKRSLDRVRLLTPDEAKTEVAPGSVDVIVAAEVLEHIDEPADTLAFFRSALKPAGALLVSLPTENAAYRFGRRLAGFDGHFHVHNAESVDRVLRSSGFRLEESSHVPLPGPLSIYFVARYSPA
jgi:2-polyprenyl-3-methyl-5-hydroxy-6-metoxy-1,4-benzoquinol methylase